MNRFFAIAAFVLQFLGSVLVILMLGSNLAGSARDPYLGMAAVVFGIPMLVLLLCLCVAVFILRDAISQPSRDRMTMASTILILATTLVVVAAAMK